MRAALRVVVISIFLLAALLYFLEGSPKRQAFQFLRSTREPHPIDILIQNASIAHEELLTKQTSSIDDAASAYRKRRHRHPPPRFNEWVEYALSKNAVIIEDLFDRIYDDLRPFWAVKPAELRKGAAEWEFRIAIRNGTASLPPGLDHAWMNLWFEMITPIAEFLPDVDLAFNHMDESRILVPWEDIEQKVKIANEQVNHALAVPKNDMTTIFPSLAPLPNITDPAELPRSSHPFTSEPPLWKYAREACPPTSPGRNASIDTDFTTPPYFPSTWPAHTHHGFVTNWTLTKDVCTHPHLRNLHGAFIEPVSLSISTKLFPLFGGSKLSINNEILLPAPAYWSQSPFYSGGTTHVPWSAKSPRVTWRGAASGGRNHIHNWRHFHRHRFVALLNGSQVDYELNARKPLASWLLNPLFRRNISAANFPIPSNQYYPLRASKTWLGIGRWIKSWSDVVFAHLECFPRTGDTGCDYTAPFYNLSRHTPMAEQYTAKYLPDIDGNSYSGRYPAFLRSNSLPLKSTIYDEWHDSRLVPWIHFVPFDSTYVDFLGIAEYFLGLDGKRGRDGVAEGIATKGKEWAEKVLRREDMLVYVYRLVLEYARVVSEGREGMGWVRDVA